MRRLAWPHHGSPVISLVQFGRFCRLNHSFRRYLHWSLLYDHKYSRWSSPEEVYAWGEAQNLKSYYSPKRTTAHFNRHLNFVHLRTLNPRTIVPTTVDQAKIVEPLTYSLPHRLRLAFRFLANSNPHAPRFPTTEIRKLSEQKRP